MLLFIVFFAMKKFVINTTHIKLTLLLYSMYSVTVHKPCISWKRFLQLTVYRRKDRVKSVYNVGLGTVFMKQVVYPASLIMNSLYSFWINIRGTARRGSWGSTCPLLGLTMEPLNSTWIKDRWDKHKLKYSPFHKTLPISGLLDLGKVLWNGRYIKLELMYSVWGGGRL